jgi:uncharacterized membrane protein
MTSPTLETPDVHLPGPSFWPIVLAAGVIVLAAGVLLSLVISAVGVAVILASIAGWTQENRREALAYDDEEEAYV